MDWMKQKSNLQEQSNRRLLVRALTVTFEP